MREITPATLSMNVFGAYEDIVVNFTEAGDRVVAALSGRDGSVVRIVADSLPQIYEIFCYAFALHMDILKKLGEQSIPIHYGSLVTSRTVFKGTGFEYRH